MTIPKQVSAQQALAQQQGFSGALTVKSLPRLAEVADGQGAVTVELQVSREGGYPSLQGHLGGKLALKCQRCGKVFDWTLDSALDLRLVFSEDEERAAMEKAEPLLIENDVLALREVVEDEVLLALPMLSRCKTCENKVSAPVATPAQPAAPRRDNPFAVLKGKLEK